ncbi:hypothetical protein [Breoghania sp.]|uniref:hypothetical protein n=1 Tax=Breoghania sp. TaxID=2065378 RepID=UPI002AA661F7|nr:hypothetical protein [Breoghania sp.]
MRHAHAVTANISTNALRSIVCALLKTRLCSDTIEPISEVLSALGRQSQAEDLAIALNEYVNAREKHNEDDSDSDDIESAFIAAFDNFHTITNRLVTEIEKEQSGKMN